jgi:hypothetical protein
MWRGEIKLSLPLGAASRHNSGMTTNTYDFAAAKEKRVTLLGMSGVGKTSLSTILEKSGWFHYSGDVRIGRHYLKNDVPESDKITMKNLVPLSRWLGRPGDPALGGMAIEEFKRRLKLHLDAEVAAMLDVPEMIEQARQDGFTNFINDAGGSLCELDAPEVFETLAEHTLIVYIKATPEEEDELFRRAVAKPKPLYYPPAFLDWLIADYCAQSGDANADAMNPDDFFRFAFPKLFQARLPKYEAIARQYGVIVSTTDLATVKTGEDFIEILSRNMKRR